MENPSPDPNDDLGFPDPPKKNYAEIASVGLPLLLLVIGIGVAFFASWRAASPPAEEPLEACGLKVCAEIWQLHEEP